MASDCPFGNFKIFVIDIQDQSVCVNKKRRHIIKCAILNDIILNIQILNIISLFLNNNVIMTGATSGAGSYYLSGTPDLPQFILRYILL